MIFFRLKLYPFPIRPDIPCPDGNTIELPLSNLEKAPWPLLLPAPCSIPKNKLFGPAVCKQIKQENQYHKAFRQLVTTVKEGYKYILKVDNCHFLDLAFYYLSCGARRTAGDGAPGTCGVLPCALIARGWARSSQSPVVRRKDRINCYS